MGVKPIEETTGDYSCGQCGNFVHKEWSYCPCCGEPVDWLDTDYQKAKANGRVDYK